MKKLFLGQVAFDRQAQELGIGGMIMWHHVFEKALVIADEAGCHAILLDVMSDGDEKAFRKRKGCVSSIQGNRVGLRQGASIITAAHINRWRGLGRFGQFFVDSNSFMLYIDIMMSMRYRQTVRQLYVFSMALPLLPVLMTACVAGNSDPTVSENSINEGSINNVKNFSESSFNKNLVTIPTVKGKLQDKNGNPLSGMRVGSSFWVFEAHKRFFNETVFSGADGSFTIKTNPHTYQSHRHLRANVFITVASPWLQEEIKLANTPVENMCYHPYSYIVRNVTNKERDVGVIKLTKQIPEPTGSKRYAWSLKTTTPKKTFKLTINQCVKEIKDYEFGMHHPIIQEKAKAEGIDQPGFMVAEISLPRTLAKIGKFGFWDHYSVTGTLTIPKNVRTIERGAFGSLGDEKNSTTAPIVVFESGSKLKSIAVNAFWRAKLRNFKLPENLETIGLQAFGKARFFPQGKLTIPSKVSKIEDGAFQYNTGITSVDILSEKLKKTIRNYPLGEGLFSDSTPGITHVNLPKVVAGSYYRFELINSFGDVQFNHQSRD